MTRKKKMKKEKRYLDLKWQNKETKKAKRFTDK